MSLREGTARLHSAGRDDWSLLAAAIDEIRRRLQPGMRTLETGAGHTTLMFAKAGCVHTAITPAEIEVERIRQHALTAGIPLDSVAFVVAPSQDALPGLRGEFDLALIDGSHAYPLPQIDFYYASRLLTVGGILVLDDVPLWTVRPLWQYLKAHPAWTHLVTVDGRTAFFRKDQPWRHYEWNQLPFTYQQSRLRLALNYAERAWGDLRRGDGKILWAKVKRRLHR